VREVISLEVTAVQAGPLGAEVVVPRAEGLGGRGVGHDRADLLPDQLGHDLVGRRVHPLVGEHAEDAEQLALLPGRLEALPADLLARRDAEDVGQLAGDASSGPPGVVPVGVAVLT
jgi:hypothetical protein